MFVQLPFLLSFQDFEYSKKTYRMQWRILLGNSNFKHCFYAMGGLRRVLDSCAAALGRRSEAQKSLWQSIGDSHLRVIPQNQDVFAGLTKPLAQPAPSA